jgi:hypothetical protein
MESLLIKLLTFLGTFSGRWCFHAGVDVGYVSSNLVSHPCCCPLQKHGDNTLILFKITGEFVGKTSNELFGYAFNVLCANFSQASLSPKQSSSLAFHH